MYRHGRDVCVSCGETLAKKNVEWSERGLVCWRCSVNSAPPAPRDERGRAIALGLAVFCAVQGVAMLLGDHLWWALADLAVALPLVVGARRAPSPADPSR